MDGQSIGRRDADPAGRQRLHVGGRVPGQQWSSGGRPVQRPGRTVPDLGFRLGFGPWPVRVGLRLVDERAPTERRLQLVLLARAISSLQLLAAVAGTFARLSLLSRA